jgi:hypothetical protein
MRSYTKILATLDAFPEAFICTADDDMYYWPTWLEELVDGIDESCVTVSCHRALEMVFNNEGKLESYLNWVFDAAKLRRSDRYFPLGVGGILYPPGILKHSEADREAAFALSPFDDDVWLFWMGRRNGARYRIAGRPRTPVYWPGSQERGLWQENQKGRVDLQIGKMIERFGLPDCSV